MNRLTDRDDLNQAVVHPQYCGDDISWEDYIGLLIDRLAAYEDTGLEPEEIAGILVGAEDYHLEQESRIECAQIEAAQLRSERDAAVEHHGKITALKISGFGIDLEIATPANLLFRCEAETVFLTRDEAEAALKEAEQE